MLGIQERSRAGRLLAIAIGLRFGVRAGEQSQQAAPSQSSPLFERRGS
jgi:hypothetical protein